MGVNILIATPIRSFGELISQALQEVGYYPLLVADVANALDATRVETISLAVLDCKMPAPGTEFLAAALHEQITNLPIIFLLPDESCHGAVAMDPHLDVKLPHPFYLPDLLTTVDKMLPGQRLAPPPAVLAQSTEIPPEFSWLKDVNRAAQYLTRLSLEADAQAALIIRYLQIWAYAGQLPQSGAEELTHLVGQHWAAGVSADLARFVRLSATGAEYILYATGLGAGFVLALAFEMEVPFSKMRAQARLLARKLTSPLPDLPDETEQAPVSPKKPALPDIDNFTAQDWVPEKDELLDESEDWDPDDAILARQTAMFENLLASIDIPDPDGASQPVRVQAETALDRQVEIITSGPATLPEAGIVAPLPFLAAPNLSREPATLNKVQLEAPESNIHDLAYACALIPRLPTHLLTGDLNALLNRTVTRLCLAFDWGLEHLSVRPQYLHWVVNVSPDVSPEKVIREIREQTSKLVFGTLPQLANENPSGDFWAPGFMVVQGHHTFAGDRLQDFIRQTRNRQGLE